MVYANQLLVLPDKVFESRDWYIENAKEKLMPCYETARLLAKKMNGIPLSSFPEVVLNTSTTAHILGGCCIGDSPKNGVVSPKGELFNYPNLYVVDGSVVSANLGVNLSLTITALSEYIMSKIPNKS